jgi:hypothetical protein
MANRGDSISVLFRMVKVDGVIWVGIRNISEVTQEVEADIMIPLHIFDMMVLHRDEMVRQAQEITEVPQMDGSAG